MESKLLIIIDKLNKIDNRLNVIEHLIKKQNFKEVEIQDIEDIEEIIVYNPNPNPNSISKSKNF
jgi:hypothetical protein